MDALRVLSLGISNSQQEMKKGIEPIKIKSEKNNAHCTTLNTTSNEKMVIVRNVKLRNKMLDEYRPRRKIIKKRSREEKEKENNLQSDQTDSRIEWVKGIRNRMRRRSQETRDKREPRSHQETRMECVLIMTGQAWAWPGFIRSEDGK